MTVRGDRALVRIYLRNTLLKVHPRHAPGRRSTDFADYPPAKTPYSMRDASYLIRQATEQGDAIGRFTAQLLAGVYPWANSAKPNSCYAWSTSMAPIASIARVSAP